MAAIQGTRVSSSVVGMFAVAISAALLVGGASGYLVRSLSSQVSAPATVVGNLPVKAVDQVPTWVQKYNAPAEAPQFKVDEFIRSLDYAPTVNAANLPTWVQQYVRPAEPSRFKVDEFIGSLDYARPAELPAWVQQYVTPAESRRFKVDDFIAGLS